MGLAGAMQPKTSRTVALELISRRYLSSSAFIDAIAPTEDGFSRIHKEQYNLRESHISEEIQAESAVFRVADISRRGMLSWEDFVVFETCKSALVRRLRPVADAISVETRKFSPDATTHSLPDSSPTQIINLLSRSSTST